MQVKRGWDAQRQDVLDAVEAGQVSVEELLDVASESRKFREAVTRKMPAMKRRLHTHPHARRVEQNVGRIVKSAREFLEQHGECSKDIINVGWGAQYSGSASTACYGLVVIVDRKRKRVADERLIPQFVTLGTASNRQDYRIDVQPLDRLREHSAPQTLGRRGDQVELRVGRAPNERIGTLSALQEEGTDSFTAFLSGHVALTTGVRVRRKVGNKFVDLGKAVWVQHDDWLDAAVVTGVSRQVAKEVALGPRPAVRLLESHAGRKVKVYGTQGSGWPRIARVDEVGVPVSFNGDVRRNLIKLDRLVTSGGDSGAPVVDSDNRLVGFVVGGSHRHTYLLRAKYVLDAY